jgi:hypothetical protein
VALTFGCKRNSNSTPAMMTPVPPRNKSPLTQLTTSPRTCVAMITTASLHPQRRRRNHPIPAVVRAAPSSRKRTGQSSFLIDRQISSRWDAFTEYAGDFPQRGGPQHLLHFGTAFKLTSNQQLDFHFGFGLSSATADHLIGFGYSLQFRTLHHEKHNKS